MMLTILIIYTEHYTEDLPNFCMDWTLQTQASRTSINVSIDLTYLF